MITKEKAKEIWNNFSTSDYTDQEIDDRYDVYCCAVTRTFKADEGTFWVSGLLVFPDDFDADEVRFEGKDGECYSFPAYEKVKAL